MNHRDYLLCPGAQQPQHASCLGRVKERVRIHAASLPRKWAAPPKLKERGVLVSDRTISPAEISCRHERGVFLHKRAFFAILY
jgi:hypothetical protein